MDPIWLEGGLGNVPLPPPADFPLVPRPRGHEYLRMFADMACQRKVQPVSHALLGPPYSLLLVEKPDTANAFSYGFGPNGGGGVVVYSGFLDHILCETSSETSPPEILSSEKSWWSFLFGSLFSLSAPPPKHYTPTPEQTSELAILLAHELAHLVLSHHLESLSSGTVVVPGVISMLTDVVRALLFPVTMIFGPFVNDALAQIGNVGSGELARLGENCSSVQQEVEADVVSARCVSCSFSLTVPVDLAAFRLLAHAGFDARHAVSFWEKRQVSTMTPEKLEAKVSIGNNSSIVRQIMGSGHPVDEVRVESLKSELARWETERQAVLRRLELERQTRRQAEV
jgi:Zn-dependent protease with chaperone function